MGIGAGLGPCLKWISPWVVKIGFIKEIWMTPFHHLFCNMMLDLGIIERC